VFAVCLGDAFVYRTAFYQLLCVHLQEGFIRKKMEMQYMAFTAEFFLFLVSVVLISLTGVMMPGPLFAATIEKSTKRKTAGLLIALGHGIVEFPLMFLIYYGITQIIAPEILQTVQVSVGLIGGLLMMLMGIKTFRNRNKTSKEYKSPRQESLIAGIWTTAANAGFILWWLTIGTTLIITARTFGLIAFMVFAGVHWLCDFFWYTGISLAIFLTFCFVVFFVFGVWFFGSALWIAINTLG
jgi:threonine/homoserine/homoserine lactone efflux protein